MEGYNNSYQNSSSARETEFKRLAQNIGTNIQKIQQNGIIQFELINFIFKFTNFSVFNAENDYSNWNTPGERSASNTIVS